MPVSRACFCSSCWSSASCSRVTSVRVAGVELMRCTKRSPVLVVDCRGGTTASSSSSTVRLPPGPAAARAAAAALADLLITCGGSHLSRLLMAGD